ncbi:protein-lysine N-methyltransferase EEF2KMT isoform 2-T2 [Cochliomyia hominivorax]
MLFSNALHIMHFPKNLQWNQQKILMDNTFCSELNKKFPIKLSYQLHFLKKIILHLEQYCTEVHDEIYQVYCQLQQNLDRDSSNKYAFKHYVIEPNIYFTIKESKGFVAEGTTGLCSWQASLALADYFIQNPNIISGKRVIELGAGTGLCGLIIFKMCHPKHLLLTDGSRACVELMCENLERNFPKSFPKNNMFKMNEQVLECLVVPWKGIEEIQQISNLKLDIIVAADVVYDNSCFTDLASAINFIFNLRENKVEMYLAATVRNEHTLHDFLNILNILHFKICEYEVIPVENSYLYWDRSTPVKILKLSK